MHFYFICTFLKLFEGLLNYYKTEHQKNQFKSKQSKHLHQKNPVHLM